MNQILMTDNQNLNQKKKNKTYNDGPIEIRTICKFFAIIIMLFGFILAGNGVYALVQDAQSKKLASVPVVTINKKGKELQINIENKDGIKSVTYYWNDSVQLQNVTGQNKTSLSFNVTLPVGNSKLNIEVTDSNGIKKSYVKNYFLEGEDLTEPEINFEVVDENIKIIVTDDRELDYVAYIVGDGEEQIVEANEENPAVIEILVPVSQGQVNIKVEAVDKAQNVANEEQEIKGATKPIIEVVPDPEDPSYLIVRASDEEGLRMVAYYIGDDLYQTDPNISINEKTLEWRQKVEPGETIIKVHAYNINEQVTEFIGQYTY